MTDQRVERRERGGRVVMGWGAHDLRREKGKERRYFLPAGAYAVFFFLLCHLDLEGPVISILSTIATIMTKKGSLLKMFWSKVAQKMN